MNRKLLAILFFTLLCSNLQILGYYPKNVEASPRAVRINGTAVGTSGTTAGIGQKKTATSNKAVGINRKVVVTRHNPHVTAIDSLSSLTVGNGSFAFTVDATGLQTFPRQYSKGVCLGTFGDGFWHHFPNENQYQQSETWVSKDFGRGHKELYAAQFKQPGRQRDASNYLRENPHRMHLGNIGLDLSDPAKVKDVDETLDLWTGKVTSSFTYEGQKYKVETVCSPDKNVVATHVQSDGKFAITFRFAYPTGGHSDDACDWTKDKQHETQLSYSGGRYIIKRKVDVERYTLRLMWKGKGRLIRIGRNALKLVCPKGDIQLQCEFGNNQYDGDMVFQPFADWYMASAGQWADYWSKGGFIDFGHVKDPRAQELERRVILSQYLMRAQECGDFPPQETGLTYNSWFGKFHLEMTWWHLAHYALWGHPDLLDRPLSWYRKAEKNAIAIAYRQGFKGARWMKMTDPNAGEAPSNVGSYLIWQQPHLIYLSELLYRACSNVPTEGNYKAWLDGLKKPNGKQRLVLRKYGRQVQLTADFMADFAEYDPSNDRYILRGCIPAQETLKADSTVNPPFELSYWMTTLKMAQRWRERDGLRRVALWDSIIGKLSPLAYNSDSLYLAAETATQTYLNRRFTSDHPALLGALGMMPQSRLINDRVMGKTLDWIWDHWNWSTSWGWDFSMTAMTCARLGEPSRAVDALLMKEQKNTYLISGHNYQDGRLRVYMPGNGGLLTAVAMMAAGWDGCTLGKNPGFPKDWDVRWEGLFPMP
ncbi:MAG: glycoside hydrolase N-terminal domain-containing protein [Prevotella sp.]|nr:glycoside hydrolase N-terminal domain-containing protein [Prevotella sp.]